MGLVIFDHPYNAEYLRDVRDRASAADGAEYLLRAGRS